MYTSAALELIYFFNFFRGKDLTEDERTETLDPLSQESQMREP